jgi:CelD/BcsL family acetyltransferase involved in cellulose biosynthesis
MSRWLLLAALAVSVAALLASASSSPPALGVAVLAVFLLSCPGIPLVALAGLDRDLPLAIGLVVSLSLALHGLLATNAVALGGLPAVELVRGTAILSLAGIGAVLVRDAGRPSRRGTASRQRSGPSFRVSVVTPAELGPAELETWARLQARSLELSSGFLAPEFALAVGEVRPHARVAVLEQDGEAVGFLGFEQGRFGVGRPIGAGLTEVQGVVAPDGLEWDPRALLRGCGLAVLELDRLLASQASPELAGATSWRAPVIELDGTFETYLDGCRARSKKLVSDTFYKLRRLEREHGLVRVENRAGDPEALRAVLAWKSAQYRRSGLADRFADGGIVELVERLLAVRGERFSGVLPTLLVDGKPVAGHVMLRCQHVLTGWFPAYDPAFSRFSPGLILRLLTARSAARAGIEVIELGREGGDYKERLKTGDRLLVETALSRPGVVAGARWARREPERLLRATVVKRPALYATARRSVATAARLRSLGRD